VNRNRPRDVILGGGEGRLLLLLLLLSSSSSSSSSSYIGPITISISALVKKTCKFGVFFSDIALLLNFIYMDYLFINILVQY
jgi:hypothetical protein